MKAAEFLHSIESDPQPDSTLCVELQALWWVKKGDWERAHDLAQDAGSMEGDWIHAHLHRVEGDFGNASYWYSSCWEACLQTRVIHRMAKYNG